MLTCRMRYRRYSHPGRRNHTMASSHNCVYSC